MRQAINWKLVLVCALAGAFLGLWIVTAGVYLNRAGIRLEPMETDDGGNVLPGSAFHLTLSGDPEPDGLRERIETDPPVSLEITRREDEKGSYLLTPLKPLEGGTEITFRIDGREFTFTVANQLLVLSHFPADGAAHVPVQSGIEFLFNTQDITTEAFERHLVISPPVEGDASLGDGRFVFYPVPGYDYETEYTVTLLAGLESKTGAVLAEDFSFSFTTISEELEANSWRFQIAGNSATRNTLTSEITGIQIYLDQEIVDAGEEVHVTLHSFESGEQYLEGMTDHITRTTRQQPDVQINTEEMEEYAAFSLQPIPLSEGGGSSARWLLEFPETLPEGWYAATYSVTVPGRLNPDGEDLELERQMFLQISDISVFYMFYDTNMLVWVNDAATGQPIENAEMQVSGAYRASGATGADGVLSIGNAEILEESYDQSGGVFTITAGDRLFVDSSYFYSYSYYNSSNPAHHYMSYLFTDRPIYMTSDTIQVWGMVRPRYEDTPQPENLTLSFAEGMAEQDVTLNGDGTFTATLTYEDMAASYWSSLNLRMGDDSLTSQYLRVEDYVKPVYTASTETDQVVYMLGHDDTPVIRFEVSTFDGTPAARFSAKVSGTDSLSLPGAEMYTDEQGSITIEAPITSSENSWYPRSHYYYWRNEDAEQENFYLYGNVYAIHRDVMLLGRPEQGTDGMDLHVTTHGIDVSGVTETYQLWDWDDIRGGALSQEVTATLKRLYWTREPNGTAYDYINRVTKELYYYEQHDDVVEVFTFSTLNGSYTLSGLPQSSWEDGTYYVELTTRDSLGRTVESTSYLGPRYDRYGKSSGTRQYVLDKVLSDSDLQAQPTNDGYEYSPFSSIRSRFTDNENVTFVLMDDNEEVTDFSGRILYAVAQDGFSRVNQTASGSFTLPFGEDLLPNYVITGAYFDGKHIFALQDKYMSFDPEQRTLDITLTTDKDSYRPGEEMTVTAQVNNGYTGAAAANTQVVLAVVDEAIFSIQEQYVTLLNDMYRSVYYPNITKYASYNQSDIGGAGEKGGGGGEEPIRTDFEDTAFFSTAATDSGGGATFTLKLPDNITSWRLTSLALSPENHAGNAKINRSATQEFFLMPVVNDAILTGDSFSVGLRGSGRGVSSEDAASYQVTVEGSGVNETKEVSSPLRAYASLTFDGLAAGDYTVTIRGQCGSYSDAVQLPFTVKPSGIEVSLVKSFRLSEGIDVDPLRYPVCIHFYDRTYQNYNRVLRNVNWLARTGVRADQRLGRRYAADQFEKQGVSWYSSTTEEENITDINGVYLLSLFPYSNEDLEVSALAHLAVPELVGKGGLSGWTASGLEGTDGAAGAVYLAQTISGEEFSEDLNQLLSAGDLDYVDRIYIAMAMALSGDVQGANQAYDQLVTPNIKELTGISGDKAVYVAAKDDERSDKDCTAAALLLAVLLEKDEAHELVRYLVEKRSRYEPYILEQLYYLTRFEPAASEPAQFSYQMNGQAVTEVLDRHYKHVSFTKNQLAGASFKELSGEVYADVFYVGDPADVADRSQKLIGFTKTMEVVGGGEPAVGSVVKFTLTPDFSGLDASLGSSQLVIDDYIPTGMRFERYDSEEFRSNSRGWYLHRRQGQSIQFIAWGSNSSFSFKPIVYYARCAAPGDYVVESAYINSGSSDLWGATERERVTIR